MYFKFNYDHAFSAFQRLYDVVNFLSYKLQKIIDDGNLHVLEGISGSPRDSGLITHDKSYVIAGRAWSQDHDDSATSLVEMLSSDRRLYLNIYVRLFLKFQFQFSFQLYLRSMQNSKRSNTTRSSLVSILFETTHSRHQNMCTQIYDNQFQKLI